MCRWLAYMVVPRSIEHPVYGGPHALAGLARHSCESRLVVQGDGGSLGWYDHRSDRGSIATPGRP